MALARTYEPARRAVVTTLDDAYRDRLARPSDIREYMPFLYQEAGKIAFNDIGGKRVLELGSRKGNSTLAFLAAIEKMRQGHVWSVDVDDIARDPAGMAPWKKCPWWTFVHGDDMDPDVQAKLPAKVDVLFIDTSHEYEHTLAELRAYMPRVAPGGVALFHDTHLMGWPGYEWDGDVSPVWAALDEYCAEAGLRWEDMPGKYGLGVIRP